MKDSAKYRTLYNWYVQLTPGAIFQPVESPSEMLRRYVQIRETFPQAECGLMRAEIIRASGKMYHLEVWPLTTAGTVEIRATDRTDDTDALTDGLARAVAVWRHAGVPITQGFACA